MEAAALVQALRADLPGVPRRAPDREAELRATLVQALRDPAQDLPEAALLVRAREVEPPAVPVREAGRAAAWFRLPTLRARAKSGLMG